MDDDSSSVLRSALPRELPPSTMPLNVPRPASPRRFPRRSASCRRQGYCRRCSSMPTDRPGSGRNRGISCRNRSACRQLRPGRPVPARWAKLSLVRYQFAPVSMVTWPKSVTWVPSPLSVPVDPPLASSSTPASVPPTGVSLSTAPSNTAPGSTTTRLPAPGSNTTEPPIVPALVSVTPLQKTSGLKTQWAPASTSIARNRRTGCRPHRACWNRLTCRPPVPARWSMRRRSGCRRRPDR
jgi:hypothetical protein